MSCCLRPSHISLMPPTLAGSKQQVIQLVLSYQLNSICQHPRWTECGMVCLTETRKSVFPSAGELYRLLYRSSGVSEDKKEFQIQAVKHITHATPIALALRKSPASINVAPPRNSCQKP